MNKEHVETLFVVALSLAVAEIYITPLIAGFLNPILTPIGIAYV